MGTVWEAWHTTLGIPVAVKLLRNPGDRESAVRALERFRMEAQVAARIDHPSVVRVFDFGEDDRPYLIMELVRGPDLQAWMRTRTLVDEILALKVVGHVGVGLAAMHRCGVVHRDLKPSNILISEGVALKIADLGLARSPGDRFREDTISGTPQYIAPESIGPANGSDPRSDLYSLGVILYRMLLGRLPFMGSAQDVLRAQMRENPDWSLPEEARIDAGTLFIARRLLEKDPERRLQSAVEVVQACREQVSRLQARMEDALPENVARSGVRRPLLRERLAELRREERARHAEQAGFWRKRWGWFAAAALVAAGYFAGRM